MSRPVACPWLVGALTRSETSVDDLKPRHARGFLYRPSSGRARSASRSSQAARLAAERENPATGRELWRGFPTPYALVGGRTGGRRGNASGGAVFRGAGDFLPNCDLNHRRRLNKLLCK